MEPPNNNTYHDWCSWIGRLDLPDFLGSVQLSAIPVAERVVSGLLAHKQHYLVKHLTTG